ncbi:MAG: hypothetical protein ACRDQ7_15290 [Haloechinothrix sp.]
MRSPRRDEAPDDGIDVVAGAELGEELVGGAGELDNVGHSAVPALGAAGERHAGLGAIGESGENGYDRFTVEHILELLEQLGCCGREHSGGPAAVQL